MDKGYQKKYHEAHQEQAEEYRLAHKGQKQTYDKEYYQAHKEQKKLYYKKMRCYAQLKTSASPTTSDETKTKMSAARKGKKRSDKTKEMIRIGHLLLNQSIAIKQSFFDWLETREQNLKKLAYVSDDEKKLKYLAQIDFLETLKVNVEAIIDQSGKVDLEV